MLIACPNCSQQFVKPNVAAGCAASCPSCHSPVTIPGGTGAVPVHNPGANQSGANVPAIVLGIISALIGAFALLFCWIPFLGMLVIPFAVIGAGIGSIGLIAVIFTRGKGLGMPLVGTCLCALSILISVLFTGATVSAIDEAIEESERNAAIEISDSNGSVLERGEPVSKAVPEAPRAKKKATANAENSSNMGEVLMELQTYAHRSRKKAFPSTLEELELIDVAGKKSKILFMQCEDGKLRPWVYVAGVVPQKDVERIVLHSPKAEAGERMVGLSDGSVRTMPEAAFQVMLEKQVTANESEAAESDPAESDLAESEPVKGEPAEGEPAEGEPAEGEPAEGEPAEGEPAEGEPAEDSETPEKAPLAGVWTNKSGKEIEATLLGVEGDKAVLRMANGKTYRYPIESLDAESQKRVRELAAARED